MTELVCVRLRDFLKVRKALLNPNKTKFNFYSDVSNIPFNLILSHNCYFIRKNDINSGIIAFNNNKTEIYYIPISKQLSFFEILYSLNRDFEVHNYIFNINYRNLKFHQYKQYFNVDILQDLNIMQCTLDSYYDNTTFLEKSLSVRNLKFNKEELLRVSLQNLIFGNKLGREDLTLQEVWEEERSKKFIKDLCFILEKDDLPIGYGQIIYNDNKYHLVNFGIIPSERKKGFGAFFLDRILNSCTEHNINNLFLTVDTSNIAAINLYEHFGFKHIINTASIILKSR
jgi:ribosomal protein S18 acetylase RimI-like enzyme